MGMPAADAAWAETTDQPSGRLADGSAAPLREAEEAPPAASRPSRGDESGRVDEPGRARPSDALIRVLMLISSANGGRPIPLMPR